MNKVVIPVLALFFLGITTGALAQKNVYISKDVVKTADQIKFDYKGNVKKAANKDAAAIVALFEFSRIVDGAESTEHAVTCLEIIPQASDEVVAHAIEQKLHKKLKKTLLERLTQAQKQTKQEALKQPIKSWAPLTWEALNGRPIVVAKPAPQGQNGGAVGQQQGGSLQDAEKNKKPVQSHDGSLKPSNSGRGGGN